MDGALMRYTFKSIKHRRYMLHLLFVLCLFGYTQAQIMQQIINTPTPVTGGGTIIIGQGDNGGGTDSGNSNLVEFLPIRTPSVSTTVNAILAGWENSLSSTWGVALYSDSSGTPGTLLCSAITTSTVSVGFNSLIPTGCGTLTANTTYWLAQITSSNSLQNAKTTSMPVAALIGLSAYQDLVAHGGTTFASSASTFSPIAYSGLNNMLISLACAGPCGANFEAMMNSLPLPPSPTTTISWSQTVPVGGTHQVLVVGTQSESTGTVSCTYNSVSMTPLWSPIVDGGAVLWNSAFIMPNPPTGNNTITCTSSAAGEDFIGVSVVAAGVNQSTPNRTVTTATQGGSSVNPVSVTLTNAQVGDYVVNWTTLDTVGLTTMTPNNTLVFATIAGGSIEVGMQVTPGTGSSLTFTWTLNTPGNWVSGGFALIPG